MKTERREALDDAEEIIRAAYYAPCEVDSALCPKCLLLERVMKRVGEWQSEEIDAANKVARAKAAAERAALDRLREWREAELTLERVRQDDPYRVFFAGDDDESSRELEALAALRAAADELMKER